MSRTVNDALKIAQRKVRPIRFHETIARRGYAEGGVPDEESQEKFLREQLEGSAPQYEPEAGLKTAKEAGLMAAGFVPGAGIAAAAGKFPTAEGGFEPSAKEDWEAGRYGSAAMKAAGAAGDVASAIPVVGTAAGAALKAPLAAKLAMAVAPAARLAREAAPAAKVAEEANLSERLAQKYPNVDFAISDSGTKPIVVSKVVVPKEFRNQGIGTKFMNDVLAYADETGRQIALTPSSDFGGVKTKLTNWYKSLGFRPNKGKNRDFSTQEEMLRNPVIPKDASEYQGSHQSPGPENGAPLWRMHQIYPDDLYSSNGFRYYADFGNPYDREGYSRATGFRHNPNASVTIYRAVPKDASIKNINKGDWVTLTRGYAKDHGESALQGNYKILSKNVKARDLFTHGDSIHEFGYHPQPMMSETEFVSRLTPAEAKEKLGRISESARQSLKNALSKRSAEEYRKGGIVADGLALSSTLRGEKGDDSIRNALNIAKNRKLS